jgi:hypothetical protein
VFDRRHLGAVITTAGAVVALAGTFLPWLRSGGRDRSSYTIFDLVDRLGFASGGVVAVSLRLWPLVPLLLAVTVIGAWAAPFDTRARRVAVVLVVIAVVWIGGTSVAVMLAPDVAIFRIGPGPPVTLLGALSCGIGGVLFGRQNSIPSSVS